MDFTRLRIVHFLTIGDSGDIYLTGRGLNLLQGINEDDTSAESNGAGKSSIPDALCWALYDITARGESGDGVVNDKVGKDTMVEVELRDGTVDYIVRRYRKHKTFKNALHLFVDDNAGNEHDLTKGTMAETQEEIIKILGCTYEVFKASIYAGQEDMPDIPNMKDKQLKMLVEEAAGVERLERAYEIARQEENDTKRKVDDVTSQVARLEGSIRSTLVDIEAAKIRHKEFEDGREARAVEFERQSAAQKASAGTTVKAIQALGDATKLNQELAQLKTKVAGIEGLSKTATSYEKGIVQSARQAMTTAQTEYKFLADYAKKLKGEHDNAEQQVGKPCQVCAKPHTLDDLAQVRAHLKQKLVDKIAEAQKQATVVKERENKLAEVTAEHARLLGAVPDASALLLSTATINAQLLEISKLSAAARATITIAQTCLAQAKAAREETNPQAAVLQHLGEKLDADTRNIDIARTQLTLLADELEDAKNTTEVFSPAGVRAHILDTVTPFLNDRTADYLGTLSDGNISAIWNTLTRTKAGEIREKFGLEVANSKGGKTFKLLSGGEKRKVRLATMLALQDLVASRATKPLNLWMGDEIDDALDAPGLERLMSILERKAREKGTVIAISHRELRDWIDDVTVIRKPAGKSSTVEGALVELH